jgi:glycerophosphoryl diester phosphodiesterase
MTKPRLAPPDWLTARPIAHRGLHDAAHGIVENSMSAASAAIAGGYAIECDVQFTRDGEAVVFHDFDLDRLTTGAGLVEAQSVAALAQLAMKGTDDRIPTLAAFLALIAGQVPLILEIKSAFDDKMMLTDRVAAVLQSYSGPVAVKSFDPAIVVHLRSVMPERPRGIIAMSDYSYPDYASLGPVEKHAMANLLHFNLSQPDFLSWRVRDLATAAPFLCRNGIGMPVMTWTVRSADDRAMAARYADQMVFEGFVP